MGRYLHVLALGIATTATVMYTIRDDVKNNVIRKEIKTVPAQVVYVGKGLTCMFDAKEETVNSCVFYTADGPRAGDRRFCYSECVPLKNSRNGGN